MKIQKVYSFECDRCHAELTGDTKIAIFARESRLENPKKKFDLCEKCYRTFIKAMEKGVKNGKNDNKYREVVDFKEVKETESELYEANNRINDLLDIVKQKDKIIEDMAEHLTTSVHSKEWVIKYFEERCK